MTFATTTSTTSDHHIHRSICSCKIIWSLSHLQLSRGTGCVDSSPPVRPFYLFSNSFECSSPIPLSIHSCNDSSDRDNGPWPCGIANRQQPILKTRIVWIQCRYIVPSSPPRMARRWDNQDMVGGGLLSCWCCTAISPQCTTTKETESGFSVHLCMY